MGVVPDKLHARTPVVISSKGNVAMVESFIQERVREQEQMLGRS